MPYHLLIQPYDADFDFLEEVGVNSMQLYNLISSFELLPRRNLPENVLTNKKDEVGRYFVEKIISSLENKKFVKKVREPYDRGENIVFENDLWYEIMKQWHYNSREIFLAVLPYFIFNLGGSPHGAASDCNMAMASTYRIRKNQRWKAVGVCLHEVGHVLELGHCKTEYCVMHVPIRKKGSGRKYTICGEHEQVVFLKLGVEKKS
jgi:predicted Zn-dependent protease